VAGKEDSRASSFAASLGKKIHAHPASQRRWEGRFTCIRLRSAAGKEDSRASGFAASLGKRMQRIRLSTAVKLGKNGGRAKEMGKNKNYLTNLTVFYKTASTRKEDRWMRNLYSKLLINKNV
jgi:hypothetical protein